MVRRCTWRGRSRASAACRCSPPARLALQRLGHVDDLALAVGKERPGSSGVSAAGGFRGGSEARAPAGRRLDRPGCRRAAEHRARHGVGPIGGAALEAQIVGLQIDVLEGLEGDVGRTVDGLGDGAVDVALQGGLHLKVRARGQLLGGDEGRRQRRLAAEHLAKQRVRVVFYRLGARVPSRSSTRRS